jgi:hypothetical protein
MVAAAPGWRADPTNIPSGSYHQRVWHGVGNERLIVSYSRWETTDVAADVLHQQLSKISVGGLVEAPGFGEEAYLLSKYTPSGKSNLYFRRGRVVLELSSTDESLIKRAARIGQELTSRQVTLDESVKRFRVIRDDG